MKACFVWIVCVTYNYALHKVVIPIVQTQLDVFRQGWAHHRMRTCNNQTPHQLWIQGLLVADRNDCALTGITQVTRLSSQKCFFSTS